MEEESMAKGTRITVDLGSEELLKAVKFASVEQNKLSRTTGLPGYDESSGCVPQDRRKGELTDPRRDPVCPTKVADRATA